MRKVVSGFLLIYVKIQYMKKWIFLLACLMSLPAWCAEPLMLLNPGRETFLNFPSSVLPDKTITVFLPEATVPLHGKYPVVYLVGAGPKDAPAVQELLNKANHKAILVGINTTEEDLKNPETVTAFIAHELVPYIETNYVTLAESSSRAVAVSGAQGMKLLSSLLAKKELFARAFVLNGGEDAVSLAGASADLRLLGAGTRAELTVLWQTLQDTGRIYGPQAALQITDKTDLIGQLNLDYLFAPQADVKLVKLFGQLQPKNVFAASNATVTFTMQAQLANAMKFDYIPLSLHMSPPYLDWNAAQGVLRPIAGAAAGKVKISVVVDNIDFTAKLKLKK